jgi:Lon protease-like protein
VRGLPMFPLGTVLMPHMVLPLHVFEPRYRQLFRQLMDEAPEDRTFGVVRVTAGSEVGGGEHRADVGTVARILQAEELPDGRWLAVTVGTRRLRVAAWWPDDPYPQAGVELLAEDGVDAGVLARRDLLVPRVRRLLALRSELGDTTVPSTFDLSSDPATSCWQLLVLTPLPEDAAERLLGTDGWDERLEAFGAELAVLEAAGADELRGPR